MTSGASYCDVGYRSRAPSEAHPTPTRPLGIEFPGITYTEPGTPNWVGHLVTNYAARREMLAYCYAVGGARVDGVEYQIEHDFEGDIRGKPDWAPWAAEDTLFGEWVVLCWGPAVFFWGGRADLWL